MSLYNCRKLLSSEELINTLEQLTQLQHLDLSKDDPEEPIRLVSFLDWTVPLVDEDFLEQLLSSLPKLTSLDLSGEAETMFALA